MEAVSNMTVQQMFAAGVVVVSTVWSVALALRAVLTARTKLKLKVGGGGVSVSEEQARPAPCDCTMQEVITSIHALTLAQSNALDVLLRSINETLNGEVDGARRMLAEESRKHTMHMAEAAFNREASNAVSG